MTQNRNYSEASKNALEFIETCWHCCFLATPWTPRCYLSGGTLYCILRTLAVGKLDTHVYETAIELPARKKRRRVLMYFFHHGNLRVVLLPEGQ